MGFFLGLYPIILPNIASRTFSVLLFILYAVSSFFGFDFLFFIYIFQLFHFSFFFFRLSCHFPYIAIYLFPSFWTHFFFLSQYIFSNSSFFLLRAFSHSTSVLATHKSDKSARSKPGPAERVKNRRKAQ